MTDNDTGANTGGVAEVLASLCYCRPKFCMTVKTTIMMATMTIAKIYITVVTMTIFPIMTIVSNTKVFQGWEQVRENLQCEMGVWTDRYQKMVNT